MSVPSSIALDGTWHAGSAIAGGRFQLGQVLGDGGMGTVYEAFDAVLERSVAIKTVVSEPSCIYHLKNEFRAITELRHENLVSVHELFCDRGRWFFSMELIRGCPWNEWVRPHGILDEHRLRNALTQLVCVLRHIHHAGKLHRDLKPNNVLVTAAGRLVVLDFGLVAETTPGGVGQTLSDGDVIGTPSYMSPEQAAGQPAQAASDFYAVGTMIFEAITGKLPFEGSCLSVLCEKQRAPAPCPIVADDSTISDLVRITSDLLALDPGERPTGDTLSGLLANPTDQISKPATARVRRTRRPTVTTAGTRTLRQCYAASTLGKQVVVVVSSEGAKQTEVCRAFLDEVKTTKEAVVLTGSCSEREQVPYRALDPLVDDLSRHLRKLPQHRAAMLLPRDIGALVQLFPVLARVSVVKEFPRCGVVSAQTREDRAATVFFELLSRLCDWQPVVLWLDNLHAMDESSVRLLCSLFARPLASPLLILLGERTRQMSSSCSARQILDVSRANREILTRELRLTAAP